MKWVDEIEAKSKAATRQGQFPTIEELAADMELYRNSKQYIAKLIAAVRASEKALIVACDTCEDCGGDGWADANRLCTACEPFRRTLARLESGQFGGDELHG